MEFLILQLAKRDIVYSFLANHYQAFQLSLSNHNWRNKFVAVFIQIPCQVDLVAMPYSGDYLDYD